MTESQEPPEVSTTEGEYRLRQSIHPARRTVTVAMPKGWARAALSGVEAALLGWAIPALLAVLGLLAEGTNPYLRDVEMSQAAAVGTEFWGLSLGAPVAVGGVAISLIPLLWSGLQVLMLRALLVGGSGNPASASWSAVPFFTLTAVLIAAAAPGTTGAGAVALGAVVVSVIASLWAVVSQTKAYPKWWERVAWIRDGVRASSWWFLALAATGFGALGVSALVSRAQVSEIAAVLGAEGFSAVLLVLVQIAYAPVFAAWAIAWLSGAGIMVGGDELLTPWSALDADLPAFPIAAAMPSTAVGGYVIWLLILVGVICGVVTGVRRREAPFKDVALRVGVAVLFFSFLVGVWTVLSQGALGSYNLARLGPVTTAWPLVVLEVAVTAAVVALLIHPWPLAAVKAYLGPSLRSITATRGAGVPRMLKTEEPAVGAAGEAIAEDTEERVGEHDGEDIEERPGEETGDVAVAVPEAEDPDAVVPDIVALHAVAADADSSAPNGPADQEDDSGTIDPEDQAG